MNCIVLKELLAGEQKFQIKHIIIMSSHLPPAFVEKDCPENEYPIELDELLSDTVKTGVVRYGRPIVSLLISIF